MSNIEILDESVINKIAAGEVIERPASVVKELIENSIDAKATEIFIEVQDGDTSLIKVSDNGEGMDEKNARLACLRHSTSKIKKEEDLFSISTLGFRGEALASIAAVSELVLVTKKKEALNGTEVKVIAGRIASVKDIGCKEGTTIIVKNLFFNTPARRKFLKDPKREFNYFIDIVQRYALIQPAIHFMLVHNDKEVINSPATENKLTNISYILGRETAKKMLELDYTDSEMKVVGFISRPEAAISTKSEQSIYINNRYIHNSTLSNALNEAYHTLLMKHRYPKAILKIEIDQSKVDVNVHPAKAEIRFHDPKSVYNAVSMAIRKTLSENNLIPEIKTEYVEQLYRKQLVAKEPETKYLDTSRQQFLDKTSGDIKLDRLPDMVVHGVVDKTYILAETKNELLIIDQHAAAERILYEKFIQQYQNKEILIQQLLEPLLLELSPKDADVLQLNISVLKELGFNIEEFGNNNFIVRTVPSILGDSVNKDMIYDIATGVNSKITAIDSLQEEQIIRMACRAAVKAGDTVSIKEIKGYMRELDKKDIPFTCPHGRPVIIKFSFGQLEKMFKRKL